MADNERWVHVEWLGYAQPVGLVVTPPALLEAQCIPDVNVAARKEALSAMVGERKQIADLRAFLICFSDMPRKAGEKFRSLDEKEAKQWPDLYRRVEGLVKPERLAQKREIRSRYWWLFGEQTPALYEALAGQPRCLVSCIVTKHLMFSFQPSDRIFSHKLQTFMLPAFASFAVMQSRIHETWAWLLSSTMKQDLNYSASDCFENFPFPKPNPRDVVPALEEIGEQLYTARAEYMKSTNQGLTQTYNHLKDPGCRNPEVETLRDLHLALDRAVLDAYGWSSIAVPPYTTPETDEERAALEAFEDEVLDKLFALNAERAALERDATPVQPPPARKPRGASKKPKKNQPSLDFDGD